jgi:hypothetical protein
MRYLGGSVGHLALQEHVKIEDAAKAIRVSLKSISTADYFANGKPMEILIQ